MDPFKAESDHAPSYVLGPNDFKFLCYNAVSVAQRLNALFSNANVKLITPTPTKEFPEAGGVQVFEVEAVEVEDDGRVTLVISD